MTMLSPVEAAQAVVLQLEGKREALADRATVNSHTRAALSFTAHTDGGNGMKAKKALDDLNVEALKLDLDKDNLESAIAEAQKRLAAAQRAEAAVDARADAIEADRIFVALVECYDLHDQAREALAAATVRAAALQRALMALGCNSPAPRAPADAERRALSTTLQEAKLWGGQFDHRPLLHGHKIHSLKAVAEAWHASARQAPHGWIAQRLGAAVPAEAAE